MAPKISVVMSTFCRNHGDGDCPNLLRRALDSIVRQTFGDFEVILTDDGSTDGTEEVCREYEKRDRRFHVLRLCLNSGLPAKCYNDGMLLSKAPLIAFMYDDDEWSANALTDLYDGIAVKYSDCGMVYGVVGYTDVTTGARTVVGSDWDLERLEKETGFCIVGANSVIIRREVINVVGGYEENPLFRRMCDWDLWVRIGKQFKVFKIPKFVGRLYQGYSDGVGKRFPTSPEMWKQVLEIRSNPQRRLPLQGELS